MSAGPFLADRLITWFWPWGRRQLDALPRRRQFFLWLIVIGVFWAGFSAWQEEHTAREAVEKKLQQAIVQSSKHSPARDPDGFYQLGQEVAKIYYSRTDAGNGIVTFQIIQSWGTLDPNKDVEYRDLVLRCQGLPEPPARNRFVGTVNSVSRGNFSCEIVGNR